jgi:steroid delta-isomerase-like uncharacterized protein
MTGTDENKEVIRRYYGELWNRWEFALIDTLLSPDCTFRGSLGIDATGHAGFKEYMETVQAAFPDFHNAIEELIAEGNTVIARLTYHGTHRGTLFGISATNRRIAYSGVAIFTLDQGRIARGWVLGDRYGLLEQLRSAAT